MLRIIPAHQRAQMWQEATVRAQQQHLEILEYNQAFGLPGRRRRIIGWRTMQMLIFQKLVDDYLDAL
jgi:hypothetical protein